MDVVFVDNGPCLGVRSGPNGEYEWISYQTVECLHSYSLITLPAKSTCFKFTFSFEILFFYLHVPLENCLTSRKEGREHKMKKNQENFFLGCIVNS